MTIAHLTPRATASAPPVLRGLVVGRTWIVHSVLDKINARIAGPQDEPVTSADVAELERIARRVEATRLALLAKADQQQAHRRSGHTSTSAWVAGITRSGGGRAQRDVALATTLATDLPLTATAFAAGEVSTTSAGIIADTMTKLPVDLSPQERATVEASLIKDARQLDPGRLRKAATVALAAADRSAAEVAAHQEALLVEQERRAWASAHLTLHDHGDGMTSGRFCVPTGAATVLKKVLDTMVSPRRDHLRKASEQRLADGQRPAGDGDDGSVAASIRHGEGRNADWADLDWSQRKGRAFTELLEHLDTEKLTGTVASTVIVTLTLEQTLGAAAVAALRQDVLDATGATFPDMPSLGAARCDTGHHHSTSQARRLACQAGVLPLILSGQSVPLDLGREQRFFSDRQRTALAATYVECAALDCDRPFAWCELHHEIPWSRGGPTDLDHALPLCGHHHRLIHDPEFLADISRGPAGSATVHFRRRC